jgi:hypothetical protein
VVRFEDGSSRKMDGRLRAAGRELDTATCGFAHSDGVTVHAHIGHDCAHIGCENHFRSVTSKESGGCAVHLRTGLRLLLSGRLRRRRSVGTDRLLPGGPAAPSHARCFCWRVNPPGEPASALFAIGEEAAPETILRGCLPTAIRFKNPTASRSPCSTASRRAAPYAHLGLRPQSHPA